MLNLKKGICLLVLLPCCLHLSLWAEEEVAVDNIIKKPVAHQVTKMLLQEKHPYQMIVYDVSMFGEELDELSDHLEAMIEPGSWEEPGVEISISVDHELFVVQTAGAQKKVHELLNKFVQFNRDESAALEVSVDLEKDPPAILAQKLVTQAGADCVIYDLDMRYDGTEIYHTIELIQEVIEAASWEKDNVAIDAYNGNLIIYQAPAIQEQIKNLLNKMRMFRHLKYKNNPELSPVNILYAKTEALLDQSADQINAARQWLAESDLHGSQEALKGAYEKFFKVKASLSDLHRAGKDIQQLKEMLATQYTQMQALKRQMVLFEKNADKKMEHDEAVLPEKNQDDF